MRDLLLGRQPKDYDICTDASPDGVLRLFPGSGLVGAHFGVVLVREGEWQVEVATFRRDGEYSDGRRPDAVRFVGDPRNDVERRDFTINALLMDPSTDRVIDFVGGRADLEAGVIRAIGDPVKRFEEDHLRLLRAVRFAARFHFTIEPVTFAAMSSLASLTDIVAVERVREELNRILMEGGAAYGLDLLSRAGLAERLHLPVTARAIERLQRQAPLSIPAAWAALFLDVGASAATQTLEHLRFSTHEILTTAALIANHGRINRPFASVAECKRFVRLPSFEEQMALHEMDGLPAHATPAFTQAEMWPTRLLRGEDLIAAKIPQGPVYTTILREAEDAQLNGELADREGALEWLTAYLRRWADAN